MKYLETLTLYESHTFATMYNIQNWNDPVDTLDLG